MMVRYYVPGAIARRAERKVAYETLTVRFWICVPGIHSSKRVQVVFERSNVKTLLKQTSISNIFSKYPYSKSNTSLFCF